MKKLMFVMLCVGLGLVLCGTAQATNLLLNASFEEDGSWATSIACGRESWAPHTGNWGMAFYWWVGPAGSFSQDVAVTTGQSYEFKAWTLDDAAAVTTSVFNMTIEWYQGTNLLGSTSLNISPLVTNSEWRNLGISGTALTGSDMARVVVTGSNMVSGETLKVDDASFTAIPEPVTMTLLGLGSLFLARRRK